MYCTFTTCPGLDIHEFPTVWIIDIFEIRYTICYYILIMYTDLEVKIKQNSCDSIISFISNNDVIDLILYFAIFIF